MTPLELLRLRRSVRAFTAESVSPELVRKLQALVTMINTHQQGIKFQIITDDPDPLASFSQSYGIFTNPRNYLAAVVDTATPHVMERAGYFAEKFVIKAVELGLGTCYIGGTYNSKKVKAQLRAGEKILFLVIFGHPLEKSKPLSRLMAKFVHMKERGASSFFEPASELHEALDKFPILKEGLEAVACAPSSLNKRPTSICIDKKDGEEKICARVDEKNSKNLIDLGIAKFNFNFATGTECEWGNGSPLTGGDTYI